MRIAQAETAIQNYHAMRDGGELAPKQRLLLDKMIPGRIYSRRQLAHMTRLETSCVAGRINELIDMGHIEVVGVIRCPVSGKHVEAVKLSETQSDLFARAA